MAWTMQKRGLTATKLHIWRLHLWLTSAARSAPMGCASPLDKAPPDGEPKPRDGSENDAIAWAEKPIGESAGADATHDGELVLDFIVEHLR